MKSFVDWGIRENDSVAKKRAIRIGNFISASAVLNTVVFGIVFFFFNDAIMVKACICANLIYLIPLILNAIGLPDLGRPLSLISGNFVVFWFACYFRGEALLQLFFFSLSVLPFMYFAWEERSRYWLSVLSVFFIILCESYSYNFFQSHELVRYNMKVVRYFSMLAPLSQIFGGFYYFLKQSVKFEKESNEHLEKLEIEYRKQMQVQKMSSLGEMAAGIAHEINNPLTVIIGNIYSLKKEYQGKYIEADPFTQRVNKIESTAMRIARIISALRTFSRNAEHDPAVSVSVNQVIEDTLDLCRERFLHMGIKLEIETEPGLEVSCRPSEISQVLLNLLNNAYDALGEKKDPIIHVSAEKLNGNQVEILVEDNGVGIAPEVVDKIMEPFFTTKGVGKGTGLGLSVSKGIVESHHGKLNLVPNTGMTTFQIVLPSAS